MGVEPGEGAAVPSGERAGVRLVVFTRYPVAGAAKTRLIPALGAAGAAGLHRRLAERTVAVAREAGLPFTLRVTGGDPAAFRAWLGDVVAEAQGEGDLGERLQRAAAPYPVLLVGTDAPDLTAGHLLAAAGAVAAGRCAIGPAADGGYWLLGLPGAVAGVFEGIRWSTESVFAETAARVRAAGVALEVLPVLHDLDRPEDLGRWPGLVGSFGGWGPHPGPLPGGEGEEKGEWG